VNSLARSCVAELLGTFTLTFIGAGAIITQGGSIVAVALAHGLALSMAVFATAHISGGHINPAVTLAMLATKRIQLSEAVAYIVSQLLGATIAAFILAQTFPQANDEVRKLGATLGSLSDGNHNWTVLLIEAVLTFLLVTTVFAVAVDKRGPKNVYGFAIGLTIAFDILCAGALTGASMNPARSFGPALVGGHWDIHHVYWLGPLLGGCAAALVYDVLLIPEEAKQAAS
jgi:MIP family channel proteins